MHIRCAPIVHSPAVRADSGAISRMALPTAPVPMGAAKARAMSGWCFETHCDHTTNAFGCWYLAG